MKKLNTSRVDRPLLIYSFIVAALVLTFCSKSSFLYPMNDWVDVHCFFTMGRSILDGLVPYRDLYEQKGPVLYFLYSLAALISSKSFFGVFLLEIATFGLFLYFSGRIARVYLGRSRLTYLIVAVLAALIPVSAAFAHGTSCEETCLFMLVYGLYSVVLALREERPLTFWESFWNGIFAAAVLYIKFTMMGFYMGLALFVIIWYATKPSHLKSLLPTIGAFLLGVVALSLPVFGYFLVNDAANDFITVYFYNNLFLYPVEVEGSRLTMIQNCLKLTAKQNKDYFWLLYAGLGFLIIRFKQWRTLLMGILTFAGLAIGTYWGGRGYVYYGLIFCVFLVFGLVGIAWLIRKLPLRKWLAERKGVFSLIKIAALALSLTVLISYNCQNNQNAYLMDYSKEDLPAYRFAATMRQNGSPKILNYGFLDAGFYFAADVEPSCRYFCTLNLNTSEMWATQRSCIENGEVDFVITRRYTLDQYNLNTTRYVCVDQATMPFEGVNFTYYLYQKLPG